MRAGCIKRSNNPEYIRKLSEARKGIKFSEETRNKMALAKIGTTRKFTPEHIVNLKKAGEKRKLKKLELLNNLLVA